jgi:hypothetical protein
MPLSEKLKKIIRWATKRHAPRPQAPQKLPARYCLVRGASP